MKDTKNRMMQTRHALWTQDANEHWVVLVWEEGHPQLAYGMLVNWAYRRIVRPETAAALVSCVADVEREAVRG